mmetsp:Transcript_36902/g.98406  ORF Transcript_36902/g.98406 Transcript_36902/m.98406 type:complete len:119 (+) Transcript_36902:764-1120(+)
MARRWASIVLSSDWQCRSVVGGLACYFASRRHTSRWRSWPKSGCVVLEASLTALFSEPARRPGRTSVHEPVRMGTSNLLMLLFDFFTRRHALGLKSGSTLDHELGKLVLHTLHARLCL